MKKNLFILFTVLLLLAGCAKEPILIAEKPDETKQETTIEATQETKPEEETVAEIEEETVVETKQETETEVKETKPEIKPDVEKEPTTVTQKVEKTKKEPVEEQKVVKENTPKLSPEEVADKVMQGHYGNGSERKAKLEQEGYNYSEIQKIINQKIPKKKEPTKKVETKKEPAKKVEIKKEPAKKDPTNTNNSKNNNAGNKKPARTDGFNFKGYHFSIKTFHGSGLVPQETNNVFSWASRPSHYLVELSSPAGRVIRKVGVGNKVVIDGQSYRVHAVKSGIPNDSYAWDVLVGTPADITFQTCDDTTGTNGRPDLTIWWATKE